MIFRDRVKPNLDLNFLGTALVLAAIGCMLVYSATYYSDPSLGLTKRQILWVGIGIALMIVFLIVDYHVLFDIAPILYGIGIVLLLYLLIFGQLTANVRSWIRFGGFQFQPSEFMKVFTALMLARYFDSNDRAYLDFRSFLIAIGIVGLPVVLIMLQPDFGTAAAFFPLIAVAMFFGGIRARIWIAMILIVAIALPMGYYFFLKPYQRERIITFLNPERDPLGKGYQVTQAKIAIGSGGIHGKGFRHGTQAKLEFLPARHTDFIFAVLAEEWGFLGVAFVLFLYGTFLFGCAEVAARARDRLGLLLVVGFLATFGFHILYNTAMVVGLVPITGIPLPFLSYGGSFTLFCFAAVGMVLGVDFRRYVNR